MYHRGSVKLPAVDAMPGALQLANGIVRLLPTTLASSLAPGEQMKWLAVEPLPWVRTSLKRDRSSRELIILRAFSEFELDPVDTVSKFGERL
jgi:hypothetical protein